MSFTTHFPRFKNTRPMSPTTTPGTLIVKRKRDDAPVDALRVERNSTTKRVKTEDNVFFRRIPSNLDIPPSPADASHTSRTPRRFEVQRQSGKLVLVEQAHTGPASTSDHVASSEQVAPSEPTTPVSETSQPEAPRQRKRPNVKATQSPPRVIKKPTPEPDEDMMQQFLALAEEVEEEEEQPNKDSQGVTIASPVPKEYNSKYKPKQPAQRYRDRHPSEAQAAPTDPDAMDVDKDYVYDMYVRDVVMRDADGTIAAPSGTVGVIVIADEDEELWETYWQDGDESDEEPFTDDEDENAENYYGADYPDEEVDQDDEYGINPYQYYGGEEEYDADNGVWSDEEEDDDDDPWKKVLARNKA